MAPLAAPLGDVPSALHELQGGKVFSAIDIKAGFFNIPVSEGVAPYLGLVT